MSIREWQCAERPREKLLAKGSQALSNAELLAILIRSGRKGKNAVELARELLQGFGGLRAVFAAERRELTAIDGLGPVLYAQLQATLELQRRYFSESLEQRSIIRSPSDTTDYLTSELRHWDQEVFACLFLDNRHRVIQFEILFFGTIDAASVHPRIVVQRTLKHNAAALILAHNHPSGIAEPSQADCQLTRRLKQALELIDVRIIDHVIIADTTVSFAERGLL